MTYARDLGAVGQGDVAESGGKAVGLGGLVQAGLPVPPGFVLTTAAYSDFVTANNLGTSIQELAALPPQAAPQDYAAAADPIRALFRKGTMPAGIAAELNAAYGSLGEAVVSGTVTTDDLVMEIGRAHV